ncbi:hypothetical protein [Parageobacillus thermoglucosidasius]|uniref:Uncharacterized protein n=1 Tax=Parageobacillus thermoglucosidasius TaxID=1426 RepID=A0A1B7KUN2_PARTM|nr:hypothetical protein [Parageobacillus thermoglucosidasius]OAT73754.1 hypothetical protein A7K69_18000 [Parageobacillus thermoglucosidasius]
MKVRKVTLKDVEIREVNGEFEKVFVNEKTYPVFLTNYALKKGKEMGLIESSLFTSLLKMQGVEALVGGQTNDLDPSIFEQLDETKMQQVIYLAFIGANKNITMSFDEFLQKYHDPIEDTLELYMNLIVDLMSTDLNQFAKGLQQSTNKSAKNGKKLNHRR